MDHRGQWALGRLRSQQRLERLAIGRVAGHDLGVRAQLAQVGDKLVGALGSPSPPDQGAEVHHGDKAVGFVGTSARHHELGPIALAMVKRNVAVEATLTVDGMPAAQEIVVDPEVGLHVRPLR